MHMFQITTVYPDGKSETRDATPEEIAQREADLLEGARLEAEEAAFFAAEAAKRASAISKLQALGLTEEEALAIVGG
jgi:hypothetical protein